MTGAPSLIATVALSLAVAYVGGMLARLVRLPPLVGYLIAGIAVGPFTPGLIADAATVEQLAEIGVALLLFGVGLHFSIEDLVAVWRVAVPGALVQVTLSAALGLGVGRLIGFETGAAAALAACLAVASTVVATRSLTERGELGTSAGRVTLGWLVMQDLIVVVLLVLLPGGGDDMTARYGAAASLALKLAKVAALVVGMLLLGRRVIPWLLERTARDGSRELFRLSVIVAALGIAYLSSALAGVSLALGAFFAGVVISDSDVSHQAAGESVPVQQVFTVLFFVSVGMLFDPTAFVRVPAHIVAAAAAVVLGNALITALVLLALRAAPRSAAEAGAALAQIGEFSFILSGTVVARGLMPAEGRDLVLAAALISIVLQPALVGVADRIGARLERLGFLRAWTASRARASAETAASLEGHAIIVGHGRVGSVIAASLRRQGIPYVVIEQNLRFAEQLRGDGIPVVYGDAAWPEVLEAAEPAKARLLVIAVPEQSAARRILAEARRANPGIELIVRTHSAQEAAWLRGRGVNLVVLGEHHIASEMAEQALKRFGA